MEGHLEGPFRQFLLDVIARGEAVNIMFEERVFKLAGLLHRLSDILNRHHIPHEVIGGIAVMIYIEEANPAETPLTRDVDVMIHRSDLERIKEAAAEGGFRFRHVAGVDMLIYGPTESARNAVHLVFSGEMAPRQAVPNPPIEPTQRDFLGKTVSIIPVADLLRMKLSAYRLKDQVHIKALDAAGLVTPDTEKSLTAKLAARLRHLRATP